MSHTFDDSAAYELFMGRWSHAVGTLFLDWIAPPVKADWLDVGCGTGIFTALVPDRCAPSSVCAVDPAPAQIAHASALPVGQRADFRVADAVALPFADASFDVVASALVINFIPDRPRALAEMRRVSRPGGLVAGYVWDFESELSPSWPMRQALREVGVVVQPAPGSESSGLAALATLFRHAGLEENSTRVFDVSVRFSGFDAFWQAQTPSYALTTRQIAALPQDDRARLVEALRARLPIRPDGSIEYASRAHAIQGRTPGR